MFSATPIAVMGCISSDPETVLLRWEGADSGGAAITHEFSANNFKNTHYKFVDADEFEDLFLHFTQKEIGLDTANNDEIPNDGIDNDLDGEIDEDGQQRVCANGETLGDPENSEAPSMFNGCDIIDVIEGTGKKGGPKK